MDSNTQIFSGLNRDTFDHFDDISYTKIAIQGLSESTIREISQHQKEPDWMREMRLKAYGLLLQKDMPEWGPNLSGLNLQKITYFGTPEGADSQAKNWDDVPEKIKQTFDKLGIPEAEKAVLAGVGAQYDSEGVYHKIRQELQDLGVIFTDMSVALELYPDLVRKHFSKCIPLADHYFSLLHYAVWSGGTFLYVPKEVKISDPLQAYFRMNLQGGGQFEHTLIILEDSAEAHYIEGCSAPKFGTRALHAGCVEIFVGEGSCMRYSSVENWSIDTYNLNTKRALVQKNGRIEWTGGQMGSGITMLYPCSILLGENSSSKHTSLAFANAGQDTDTGAKVIHIGANTKSEVVSKSLSLGGGKNTYRGLIEVKENAKESISHVQCDGLMFDSLSRNDAYPVIKLGRSDVTFAHEATSGVLSEDSLNYFALRGIDPDAAKSFIVQGFLAPIITELPGEYAAEMNVLIAMELEGHH